MTTPDASTMDPDTRELVAKAIMDAHCRHEWTGHTLADAALEVVGKQMAIKDDAFATLRRQLDPTPWLRELVRLKALLEKAQTERVVATIFAAREPSCPAPFALYRHEDVTGASGTGLVATGAQFDDGTTVVRWRGDEPSTVVWPSLEAAEKVHGHDGRTKVVWLLEDLAELTAAIERDERAKVKAELEALRAELGAAREGVPQQV